ncbi:MAG: hypothetical protein HYU25_08435 [Candidatus Rokubacteria bacterium]|nr:hypothetical protein [Candidatus Rokubacteria bacterium]
MRPHFHPSLVNDPFGDPALDVEFLFERRAPFGQDDVELAARKYHLTARQAGLVARQAEVKRLVPFHFSPRYAGEEEHLRREAADTFTS